MTKSFRLGLLLVLITSLAQAQVPYGNPSVGPSGNAPLLRADRSYLGNLGFEVRIDGGPGGAPAFLGFTTAPANLSLGTLDLLIDLGQNLVVFPLTLSGAGGVPGTGSATFALPLTLAPVPPFVGSHFYSQAFVDEGGVFAASRGLDIEFVTPPALFVGTSVGGSADPTYLIDPLTGTIKQQWNSQTDNVTGAVFAHSGRRIYVPTNLGGQILEVDLDQNPPFRTAFHTTSMFFYGVAMDDQRRRLYALEGDNAGMELKAFDADLMSPTYGQELGATAGLASTGFVERWNLTPDGKMAIVLNVFSSTYQIVDTDPQSATYMQTSFGGFIPTGPGGFAIVTRVVFTPDSSQAIFSIQLSGPNPGEIARLDLTTGAFLDHNATAPGIQNIGPYSDPVAATPSAPTGLDMGRTGQWACVSGFGTGGGLGRIDLDPLDPNTWSFQQLLPAVSLSNAWACAATKSEDAIAVTTWSPPQMHLIEPFTGTVLSTIPLPGGSNIYTCVSH